MEERHAEAIYTVVDRDRQHLIGERRDHDVREQVIHVGHPVAGVPGAFGAIA